MSFEEIIVLLLNETHNKQDSTVVLFNDSMKIRMLNGFRSIIGRYQSKGDNCRMK